MAGLWSRSRAHGSGRFCPCVNNALGRPRCGNRESSRRTSTRHSPSSGAMVFVQNNTRALLTGRLRCARAQRALSKTCRGTGFAGPQAWVPHRGKPRSGTGGDSNTWAGERACRHRPGARSQRETELKPTKQAEATRCTAQHPAPERPTVPRETPTPQRARRPAHPQDVCPSSPSTPPRVSAPYATRW